MHFISNENNKVRKEAENKDFCRSELGEKWMAGKFLNILC